MPLRREALTAIFLLSVAGCGSAAPTPPKPTPPPVAPTSVLAAPPAPEPEPEVVRRPLPKGWWVVDKNTTVEKMNQAAFRFDDEGYWVLGDNYRDDRRTCPWEHDGVSWRCAGRLPFTLTKGVGRMTMEFERGSVELVPAAEAAVAGFEERANAVADPKAICDKAETCCLDGFAVLGAKCNPEEELAGKSSARICLMTMVGLRKILDKANKPIPSTCKE